MWIVVHMLFYLKRRALFFHLKAYDDIKIHVLAGCFLVIFPSNIIFWVVCVLHIVSAMLPIAIINAKLQEFRVNVFFYKVFSLKIYHWSGITCLVDYEK